MFLRNTDVRNAINDSGLKFWQIAEKYGMTDGNFSRKLRKELPEQEKEKILSIIKELTETEE